MPTHRNMQDSKLPIESAGYGPTTTETSQNPNSNCLPSIAKFLKSSNSEYTKTLEKDYEAMQMAFFALTSHVAKIQFRLRQIIQAEQSERDDLLMELAAVAFCGIDELKYDNLPRMNKDLICLGNIRRRQGYLIERLRSQMAYLCDPNSFVEDEFKAEPMTFNQTNEEEEQEAEED